MNFTFPQGVLLTVENVIRHATNNGILISNRNFVGLCLTKQSFQKQSPPAITLLMITTCIKICWSNLQCDELDVTESTIYCICASKLSSSSKKMFLLVNFCMIMMMIRLRIFVFSGPCIADIGLSHGSVSQNVPSHIHVHASLFLVMGLNSLSYLTQTPVSSCRLQSSRGLPLLVSQIFVFCNAYELKLVNRDIKPKEMSHTGLNNELIGYLPRFLNI